MRDFNRSSSAFDFDAEKHVFLSRLSSDNMFVRLMTSEDLGPYVHDRDVCDALIERLLTDQSYLVRRAAADVLAPHVANPTVRAGLLRALDDPDLRLRLACIAALRPVAHETEVARAFETIREARQAERSAAGPQRHSAPHPGRRLEHYALGLE